MVSDLSRRIDGSGTPYQDSVKVPLDSRQFSFVGYRNPNRFFKSRGRPYEVRIGTTNFKSYANAVYTPSTRSYKPFDGCLYDSFGQRLDATCIVRGPKDDCLNSDELRLKTTNQDLPLYERPVIYLGYINKHYGHFLLESLSRCWAVVNGRSDNVSYLFHVYDSSVLELPYVRSCFSALSIRDEDILYFRTPTIVRDVEVPSVAFQLDSYIDHAFREATLRIADAHLDRNSVTRDQPLYVSRRRLKAGYREYAGEVEIEEFLVSRGVRVIHPELLSFREQIQAFNQHKVIIGINGSGMHNLVFSHSPVTAVQFGRSWIPPTYFLIDRCFGVDSTYVYASAENEVARRLSDQIAGRLRRLSRRLKVGFLSRRKGFLAGDRLDHNRLIKWISRSGLV